MRNKLLMIFTSLLFVFGCETPNNGGMATGVPDVSNFSPGVRRNLRRMDLTQAIDTVMRGPATCGSELVRGASDQLTWEQFVAQSRRQGTNFSGPFGRVEFYNNSHLALPGERGITAVGAGRHLDQKILDILPLIAIAHQNKRQPVRISHTTSGRHSAGSHHYSGRALDIDPHPERTRMAVAEEIRNVLASSGRGCGYFVLVEATHIHVSYKGQGRTGCPGFAVDI
ncbi:MAG: hypothetical protein K9K67_00640 [Bacteriovoracaceae bacterium]|nr:hypothetical protein [Bacteriovoracaceae bacterium]